MIANQSHSTSTTIKTLGLCSGLAGLFGGLLTGLSKGGGIVPIVVRFALSVAVVAGVPGGAVALVVKLVRG